MNAHEIKEIMEKEGFFEALMDCGLVPSFGALPEYGDAFERLPEWLQTGMRAGDFEINDVWDPQWWGTDNIVEISIRARRSEKNRIRLDDWKEENAGVYAAYCSGVEGAIHAFMHGREMFEIFDTIMREEPRRV